MSLRTTTQKRLRTLQDLENAGLLKAQDMQDETYQALAQNYDIALSDHIVEQIQDKANPSLDPVGRQYIPSPAELQVMPEENEDPIGDEAHSPIKGIVHRYPDRVLLKITNICAVYCRYCFRREMIGSGSQALAEDDLIKALEYIRNHSEIWEVILTGGDPLVLSPRRLKSLMDNLAAIDHVQIIRIHSRVPIAAPAQINETALSVLKSSPKPIYLVLHVNHPQEISKEVEICVDKLKKTGCVLLSQSVLLKDVNNDAYTLESLFRKLVTLHIKPYYLHHPDLAKGTAHFRISLEEGQAIMKQLQGRLSGLCLPTYVLDIPGGYGKIPVHYNYLVKKEGQSYIAEDYQGKKHVYAASETKHNA